MTPKKKRISIGDIHGKSCWRRLLDREFDEAYFVGDYFDNYDETPVRHQIVNFLHIVKAARADPRIHLCLGNHDFHYLRGLAPLERYSGFNNYSFWDIAIALESSMDVIRPVYVTEDDVIISHAGLTSTFMADHGLEKPEDVNQMFLENRMSIAHVPGNQEGDTIHNGPIWVRPNSLLQDKLPGYRQVVGHTRMMEIWEVDGIAFIDVLNSVEKAYVF